MKLKLLQRRSSDAVAGRRSDSPTTSAVGSMNTSTGSPGSIRNENMHDSSVSLLGAASIASTVVTDDDDFDHDDDDLDYTHTYAHDDIDVSSSVTSSTSPPPRGAAVVVSPLSASSSTLVALQRRRRSRCRSRGGDSLPQALQLWTSAVGELLQSEPVAHVVDCSVHVVLILPPPIRVPLQTCQSLIGAVVGHIIQGVLVVVTSKGQPEPRAIQQQQPEQEPEQHTQTEQPPSLTDNEDDEDNDHYQDRNPIIHAAQQVFAFPGFCIGLAGHVTQEVGAAALHLISPPAMNQQQQPSSSATTAKTSGKTLAAKMLHVDDKKKETENQNKAYLDRLRLDFSDDQTGAGGKKNAQHSEHNQRSIFLLRVCDLGLCHKKVNMSVMYIDLENHRQQSKLVRTALDRLVRAGLSLIANHPPTRLAASTNSGHIYYQTTPLSEITWKMESSTARLLRKMSQLSTLERLQLLQSETLVWSGRHTQQKLPQSSSSPGGNKSLSLRRQATFYLARGIVRRSPREFLNLLWDNSRTHEYNSHCVGRETILTLQDDILNNNTGTMMSTYGAKVIRSETRVPFTGLSVHVNCLMHVRTLQAPDQGYVIVSRSLDEGPTGVHYDTSNNKKKKKNAVATASNEIIWGVNLLRAVPNQEHMTDLTSLSQVSSSLVPKFLSGKIATMGLQEFFANVRR